LLKINALHAVSVCFFQKKATKHDAKKAAARFSFFEKKCSAKRRLRA
jgi:hypothetical protein